MKERRLGAGSQSYRARWRGCGPFMAGVQVPAILPRFIAALHFRPAAYPIRRMALQSWENGLLPGRGRHGGSGTTSEPVRRRRGRAERRILYSGYLRTSPVAFLL
jgi:hypothetical protein